MGQQFSHQLAISSKILVANNTFLVALATSQSQFWTLHYLYVLIT